VANLVNMFKELTDKVEGAGREMVGIRDEMKEIKTAMPPRVQTPLRATPPPRPTIDDDELISSSSSSIQFGPLSREDLERIVNESVKEAFSDVVPQITKRLTELETARTPAKPPQQPFRLGGFGIGGILSKSKSTNSLKRDPQT